MIETTSDIFFNNAVNDNLARVGAGYFHLPEWFRFLADLRSKVGQIRGERYLFRKVGCKLKKIITENFTGTGTGKIALAAI